MTNWSWNKNSQRHTFSFLGRSTTTDIVARLFVCFPRAASQIWIFRLNITPDILTQWLSKKFVYFVNCKRYESALKRNIFFFDRFCFDIIFSPLIRLSIYIYIFVFFFFFSPCSLCRVLLCYVFRFIHVQCTHAGARSPSSKYMHTFFRAFSQNKS